MKIGVAIMGGTGFGAGELLRLIANHPNITVVAVTSRSAAGNKISTVHPHLAKVVESVFVNEIPADAFKGFDHACIISALPHGESAKAIESVLAQFPNAKVIDLSGDLRIQDLEMHQQHYKSTADHQELRKKAVYGLSESNRNAIETAKVVANPGCLATAAILSLLPFANSEVKSYHMHLATGSSGSGKEPKVATHHPVRHANFLAYKVLAHQHVPEVIQCLNTAGVKLDSLPFVAHSLPISRGILCTAFVELQKPMTQPEVESLFEARYKDCPFVRLTGNRL